MLVKELFKDLNPRISVKMYSQVFHIKTGKNFSYIFGRKQNLSQGQRNT